MDQFNSNIIHILKYRSTSHEANTRELQCVSNIKIRSKNKTKEKIRRKKPEIGSGTPET